jgi:hypothetical protein
MLRAEDCCVGYHSEMMIKMMGQDLVDFEW